MHRIGLVWQGNNTPKSVGKLQAYLVGLVTKEVDLIVVLGVQVAQAEGLVPAL